MAKEPRFKTGDAVAIIGEVGYSKGMIVRYLRSCPDDGCPTYKVRMGKDEIELCESVLHPSNEEPDVNKG